MSFQPPARSWSDLPDDVTCIIMKHLHYSGSLTRFRLVCKRWRILSKIYNINYAEKLPMLFCYDQIRASKDLIPLCSLYNPHNKRKYFFDQKGRLGAAKILSSKHGWFLFSRKPCSIFFYSPFEDKIIELPPLSWRAVFSSKPTSSDCKAEFSVNPTCSDCVVFVVSYENPGKLCICQWRYGDSFWTRHVYDALYADLRGIACMDGVLYCAFSQGLGAFNAAKNTWKVYPHDWIGVQGIESNMTELDGNLLIVYYNRNSLCKVLRFDWQRRKWLEVKDLGNKILFLCQDSNSSILVHAVGELTKLANTIHFSGKTRAPWREDVWCSSYTFHKAAQSQECPKPYGGTWLDDDRPFQRRIFIQAPQLERDQ